MRHHECIRENGLGGIVTGIVEFYETGEFVTLPVVIQLSGRIKHAPARFVADLDPFHLYAGALEGTEDVFGMFRHVHGHLVHVIGIGLPDRRDQLTGRVGKKVAVMEIHHEGQAGGFHLFGHGDDVPLAAPAFVGIHPNAQADGIEAAVFEDIQ